MKRVLMTILLAASFLIFSSSQSHAIILFAEDFDGQDLSKWTGKNEGAHSGVIVDDPLNSSNSVLSFTALGAGGDIFTIDSFDSKIDKFRLSFDYLGKYSDLVNPDLFDPNNLGGFIGYSYDYPGTRKWLAGTDDFGGSYPDILLDTGEWQHVVISFSASGSIHLMLEDFTGIAGDVYFDNILLENPPPAVPEPATIFLVGFGLLSVAGFGRKRYSKKT